MNFRKATALTVAGLGFWFFLYSHPGRKVFFSQSKESQAVCEAAADDMYHQGWDVSNCRDSDNLNATQD